MMRIARKYSIVRRAPPGRLLVARVGGTRRALLGHDDDLPGGLVVLHIPVSRNDVVQAEDTVDVGSINAGLDLVDYPMQHGRARAALEVVAVESSELGSRRDHR